MRASIRLPDEAERRQIDATLGLSPEQGKHLWRLVETIAREITTHAAYAADESPAEIRARRNLNLKKLRDSLRRAREVIAAFDTVSRSALRALLASDLGPALSYDGFYRLVGMAYLPSIPMAERHSREALSSRDGPYLSYEAMMIPRRIALAEDTGDKALAGFLGLMADGLAGYLELESRNKGGAPGDFYRRHVIERLIPLHRRWNGSRPTPSSSAFIQLCQEILVALGLSTEGLEEAVRRILRPRKTS